MTRTRRSASLHEAAPTNLPPPPPPPPYEAAATGDDDDEDDEDEDNNAREQRSFMSYSDEKQTSTQPSAQALPGQGAGAPSSKSTPSKSASKKWSSAPTLLSSILPSIPPGRAVLRARCFTSGASPQQQQLRVALATSTTLQVYDARRDALLWELHSNSSQLVQGDEEPLRFGEGFRPSPDGRLLCVVASRGDSSIQRRLLVVDAETGWVRLEYALSATDGNKPHFSDDNSMVVVLGRADARGDATGYGYFKIFSLQEVEARRPHHVRRRIRFETPAPGQAIGFRFAPDSKHLITCAGPARKVDKDAAPPSISVCVYSVEDEADKPIRCTRLPCSPKFFHATTTTTSSSSSNKSNITSKSSSTTPSSRPTVLFTTDFHFPTPQEWLVSFPDYTTPSPGPGRTCLVNARLGQIVAILNPPELSLSQKWQVGVSSAPPAQPTEVSYDPETGLFTRLDVNGTMLSRGQTLTVTRFALSANGGRERAVLRRALQIRAVVMSCRGAGDVCALSPDGMYVLVRRVGGEARMDVFSVGV
ncbi:hypothetical protein E4U21_004966 [Claviceps maximensis]|nr:hypothetical protein E4U21_004966 [Claviceps maximensis]